MSVRSGIEKFPHTDFPQMLARVLKNMTEPPTPYQKIVKKPAVCKIENYSLCLRNC